jgi:hypothetical protein
MNKEQADLFNESYENYSIEYEKNNSIGLILTGAQTYSKPGLETFIMLCQDNKIFSQKWGLTIEKRELSFDERKKLYEKEFTAGVEVQNDEWLESKLRTRNIPTRITEITYKDKTIPSYE